MLSPLNRLPHIWTIDLLRPCFKDVEAKSVGGQRAATWKMQGSVADGQLYDVTRAKLLRLRAYNLAQDPVLLH